MPKTSKQTEKSIQRLEIAVVLILGFALISAVCLLITMVKYSQ